MYVWDKTTEHNSNKIFDTIDVRKSLQIITDTMITGPEMSCLSASDSELCTAGQSPHSNNQRKD